MKWEHLPGVQDGFPCNRTPCNVDENENDFYMVSKMVSHATGFHVKLMKMENGFYMVSKMVSHATGFHVKLMKNENEMG